MVNRWAKDERNRSNQEQDLDEWGKIMKNNVEEEELGKIWRRMKLDKNGRHIMIWRKRSIASLKGEEWDTRLLIEQEMMHAKIVYSPTLDHNF